MIYLSVLGQEGAFTVFEMVTDPNREIADASRVCHLIRPKRSPETRAEEISKRLETGI